MDDWNDWGDGSYSYLGSYKNNSYTDKKDTKNMTTVFSSTCHHTGHLMAFEFDGRQVYGAGSSIIVDAKTRLVIDLAGSADRDFRSIAKFVDSESSPGFREQLIVNPVAQRLRLNWADMQAPPSGAGVSFWQKVWELMPHTPNDPEGNKTIICCMGSHGRTGTCMAALLIANCEFSMANAVNYVRYYHCVRAVESTSQIDYLRALALTAGTNTQKLDHALVEKVNALEDPTPAKSYPTQTPPKPPSYSVPKSTQQGVPFTQTPMPASSVVTTPQPISEELMKAAKMVLILVPDIVDKSAVSPMWVSVAVYKAKTYGDQPAILGVRYA